MSGKLRNLGPVSTQWLAEVGVFSRADLERVGSVAAYAMVRRRQQGASLNLLWALEVTVFLFAWLVLLGASYAVKTRAHLGVDVLIELAPAPLRRVALRPWQVFRRRQPAGSGPHRQAVPGLRGCRS